MNWLDELPDATSLDCSSGQIPPDLDTRGEPVILRGLAQSWPAVNACRDAASAKHYLSQFSTDQRVTAYIGAPAIDGRFFYDDDFTGFNFQSGKTALPQVLDKLSEPDREEHLATIYVGSTPVDHWLPGFRETNDIDLARDDALVNFWLGSRTRVSAHFDFPNNIACVVAGHRRFTLFPPAQLENLYVGPWDKTPSGQAISLVDFYKPDFDKHPDFEIAMQHATVANLAPGDAIFIPSMWWHHVESHADFNMLVNYWWSVAPPMLGSPTGALLHAILSIRDLPSRERDAWRGILDHYVFEADPKVFDHIPPGGRGYLAPLDEALARRLRADLINRLNS